MKMNTKNEHKHEYGHEKKSEPEPEPGVRLHMNIFEKMFYIGYRIVQYCVGSILEYT
jgi:hypothetical protein